MGKFPGNSLFKETLFGVLDPIMELIPRFRDKAWEIFFPQRCYLHANKKTISDSTVGLSDISTQP